MSYADCKILSIYYLILLSSSVMRQGEFDLKGPLYI